MKVNNSQTNRKSLFSNEEQLIYLQPQSKDFFIYEQQMILFKSKEQRIYSQTQNKYFNYKRSSKDIFTNAEK